MHRIMVHGRQGDAMLAISAVDCALWDLKGAGSTSPCIACSAVRRATRCLPTPRCSASRCWTRAASRDRAPEYKALGYTAQKWFFRHGPMSGADGMHKNVDLVRTLRQTLGEDYDIMLDCWQSFDVRYVIELAERIAEFRPRWLEECVMPDRIDSYRRIKERTQHSAVRRRARIHALGVQALHRRRSARRPAARHLLGGGLSETLKIAAYATAHDLMIIPHGHSTPPTSTSR